MTNTQSWAWAGSGTYPGFDPNYQDNADYYGDGLSVNPAGLTTITWVDADNNGAIYDSDTDDGSTAGQDRVVINGQTMTVREVGMYQNSTMVVDGQAYAVNMVVWIFSDGTYMVRIPDSQIPPGLHYSDVTQLTLGQWNNTEYSGSSTNSFDDPFVCFAAGTLIETADGPRAIESLVPGQRVRTADDGDQRLQWIGQRRVSGMGKMAPVRIAAGALGNRRDLWVSPNHRMLVSGWRAELLFGTDEVLVPAQALINDHSIRRDPRAEVTYVHLLFARHQIIFAEGAPSESLHPGDQALELMGAAARAEIVGLFPALGKTAFADGSGPLARRALTVREGRLMCA